MSAPALSVRGAAAGPVIVAGALLVFCASAFAQVASISVGPVARLDRLSVEGDAAGSTFAAGVTVRSPLTRILGVEGELTGAWGAFQRSYEGTFILYPPGRGPVARRTLEYTPGIGGVGALVARGAIGSRATLAVRVGASARRLKERSTHVILSMPGGIDPVRAEADLRALDGTSARLRGGLLLGLDVSVSLTDRLSAAPDLHLVWGGPARVGATYREVGAGGRVTWRF
jgi:hypothetical protein